MYFRVIALSVTVMAVSHVFGCLWLGFGMANLTDEALGWMVVPYNALTLADLPGSGELYVDGIYWAMVGHMYRCPCG
jgi:hypothetical protein